MSKLLIKPLPRDPIWKASHLDASAAVKLVIPEPPGSDHVRAYFKGRSGFYITSLCLAEALGVLKRKLLRGEISRDQYFVACYVLLAYVRKPGKRIEIDETELTDPDAFMRAEELSRRHNLDLSDSLQLVSLKFGKFRLFGHESKTVLITADGDLESSQQRRTEGVEL
jgi:predicted nucleic acid-binding protein